MADTGLFVKVGPSRRQVAERDDLVSWRGKLLCGTLEPDSSISTGKLSDSKQWPGPGESAGIERQAVVESGRDCHCRCLRDIVLC